MQAYQNNINVAIFGLTRGYPNEPKKYDDLIKRNNLIYKNINSKLVNPYKMIIFHEGNITISDQKYIQSNSPEILKFINIFDLFEKYKKFEGYKIMCKFQMYYVWEYLRDYEYVIRVDEDVFVHGFKVNTIEMMIKNNIYFSYSKLSYESHVPTNSTLPEYIKNIYNLKNTYFYNHLFPYTNFYVTRTDIWLNPKINLIIKNIAQSDLQGEYRWGDLPVLGCILNIEKIKAKRIKKLSYLHESHNSYVKSNLLSSILDRLNFKRIKYMYPNFFEKMKLLFRKAKDA